MDKTSLGDRMKAYESAQQVHFTRRVPVIIRVDGKAFHSFCRGMDKPFDDRLIRIMEATAKKLVEEVSGCEFAYTQSDEISLLLTDYKTINTQPWFGYRRDKICSVAASIATAWFNKWFFEDFVLNNDDREKFFYKVATFDARAFSVPRDDVVNYFVWRQRDMERNSVQMLGRAYFSQNKMMGKSNDEIQDMLFKEHSMNWNEIETHKKRGTCVYKEDYQLEGTKEEKIAALKEVHGDKLDASKVKLDNVVWRSTISIDRECPIFTQDRWFVQQFVDVDNQGDD